MSEGETEMVLRILIVRMRVEWNCFRTMRTDGVFVSVLKLQVLLSKH
jgi:hypothetical protein